MSALLIIGGATEMYKWGTQMWVIIVTGIIISMILVERLVIPWLFPLKLRSVFEVSLILLHTVFFPLSHAIYIGQ